MSRGLALTYAPPVTEAEHRQRAGRLADFLATHPEHHDQGTFGQQRAECGTVACAAGWASLFALGIYELRGTEAVLDRARWAEQVSLIGAADLLALRPEPGGRLISPAELGAAWLGLSGPWAADLLFLGTLGTDDPAGLAVTILRALADGTLPLDFEVNDLGPIYRETFGGIDADGWGSLAAYSDEDGDSDEPCL